LGVQKFCKLQFFDSQYAQRFLQIAKMHHQLFGERQLPDIASFVIRPTNMAGRSCGT
jgi:hypothetical protein